MCTLLKTNTRRCSQTNPKNLIFILPEGPVVAKMLPEGVLLHIERGALPAQAGHLGGLQGRHLLFDQNSLLSHIVPLLWQPLQRDR